MSFTCDEGYASEEGLLCEPSVDAPRRLSKRALVIGSLVALGFIVAGSAAFLHNDRRPTASNVVKAISLNQEEEADSDTTYAGIDSFLEELQELTCGNYTCPPGFTKLQDSKALAQTGPNDAKCCGVCMTKGRSTSSVGEGLPCAFPFTYQGKTYNTCATDVYSNINAWLDDSKLTTWCATETQDGLLVAGKWAYCIEGCSQEELQKAVIGFPTQVPAVVPVVLTPVPTPLPTPLPTPALCTTIDGIDMGKPCKFPFIFAGQTYNQCTLVSDEDSMFTEVLWCSTLTDAAGNHLIGQGHWGHCSDAPSCHR